MTSPVYLPEIVLFGASMVEWSFRKDTEGLGWFLRNKYAEKAQVLNEGTLAAFCVQSRIQFIRTISHATLTC